MMSESRQYSHIQNGLAQGTSLALCSELMMTRAKVKKNVNRMTSTVTRAAKNPRFFLADN
jgi:hypothetical protein